MKKPRRVVLGEGRLSLTFRPDANLDEPDALIGLWKEGTKATRKTLMGVRDIYDGYKRIRLVAEIL